MTEHSPSPHMVRAVAVAAMVDPKTVRRFLAGKPIRTSLRERIERALKEMDGEGTSSNGNGREEER